MDFIQNYKNISEENIAEIAAQLDYSVDGIVYEEVRWETPPFDWKMIGRFGDKRIQYSAIEYKTYEFFALGFYPYSCCDVYIDTNSRLLLSYVELGGHFPFRRNFIVGNNSLFKKEPVAFIVFLDEGNEAVLIDCLNRYGFNNAKIENDLNKFKTGFYSNDQLSRTSKYITSKYRSNGKIYCNLIADKSTAISISTELSNYHY